MTLGDRLYELRNENHIKHKEMAEKLNVGFSCIYIWESGKSLPSLPAFDRILKVFNMTYEEFMKGVDL